MQLPFSFLGRPAEIIFDLKSRFNSQSLKSLFAEPITLEMKTHNQNRNKTKRIINKNTKVGIYSFIHLFELCVVYFFQFATVLNGKERGGGENGAQLEITVRQLSSKFRF